jgi:hypothetical protein
VKAWNRTRGRSLGDRIAWAGTSEERRQGLLGRSELAAGEGLYIVPCQWIHMFGMQFPLDILFLARTGRVLGLHHSLRPNRFSKLVWRAEGVLELPAGLLLETGTTVGDVVELVDEPE